jgi:predicted protein tyrosine phosphatase
MDCVVCGKHNVKHVCGSCGLIAYCGEKCADFDWAAIHKREHLDQQQEGDDHTADLVLPQDVPGQGSLWLGSMDALSDASIMESIDAVVSAIHVKRVSDTALDDLIGDRPHVRISINDSNDKGTANEFSKSFDRVARFIYDHIRRGHNVLVHCAAGVSRSTTLVAYYMIHYRGYMSVEDALEKIRESRPHVQPNPSFIRVLRERT